jgi:hypothetical protein
VRELDAYYRARKLKIVSSLQSMLSSNDFHKRDFRGLLVTNFSTVEQAVHRPAIKEALQTSQRLKLVGLGVVSE